MIPFARLWYTDESYPSWDPTVGDYIYATNSVAVVTPTIQTATMHWFQKGLVPVPGCNTLLLLEPHFFIRGKWLKREQFSADSFEVKECRAFFMFCLHSRDYQDGYQVSITMQYELTTDLRLLIHSLSKPAR